MGFALLSKGGGAMDKNDITQRLVLAAGATDDEKLQALLIEAADAIDNICVNFCHPFAMRLCIETR